MKPSALPPRSMICAVAITRFDDAAEQLPDALLKFLDDLLALCFAHFLHDDLLCGLRGNAAELD